MTAARRGLLIAAGLFAIVLLLIPGIVWRHPKIDAVYAGFDSNLLYADATGQGTATGAIAITPRTMQLAAPAHSNPTVTLVTTPLQRVTVDLRVAVSGTGPVRIGIVSATAGAGLFLQFGGSPDHRLDVVTVRQAGVRQTLIGGRVDVRQQLGTYDPGRPYPVRFAIDKQTGVAEVDIVDQLVRVEAREFPELLRSVRLSLNTTVLPTPGDSSVVLDDYVLTLPHAWSGANQIDDRRAWTLTVACLVLSSLAVVAEFGGLLANARTHTQAASRIVNPDSAGRRTSLAPVLVGLGLLVAAANVAAFGLGSHPYDMLAEKIWAYTGATYGPYQLYYRPGTVTMASIVAGSPYHEGSFAYEPVLAYVFTLAGWIARSASRLAVNTPTLEYVIKAINLLFILIDGLLIYGILRGQERTARWSVIGASLFALNPIVWFSASVWGTSQVISVGFLLAAILAAQWDHPRVAWLALGLAALTRPQMLVAALVLAIVFARKFSLRHNLEAVAVTSAVTFLFLAPFALRISPSLPIDFALHTLGFLTVANDTPVAAQAASVWPVATLLWAHQHGLDRMLLPASTPLVGGISYAAAGLFLLVTALIIAVWRLLLRDGARPAAYLPALAFALMALVMFETGIASTHFVLALAVLVLCRKPLGNLVFVTAIVGLSVTTFVMMVGSLVMALTYGPYQSSPLYPSHSDIAQALMKLSTNDAALTIFSLLNLGVLLALLARLLPQVPWGVEALARRAANLASSLVSL